MKKTIRVVALFIMIMPQLFFTSISNAQSYKPSDRASDLSTPDNYSLPRLSPNGEFLAVLKWDQSVDVVIYKLGDDGGLTEIDRISAHPDENESLRHDLYEDLSWFTDEKLFIRVTEAHPSIGCVDTPTCIREAGSVFHVYDFNTGKLSTPTKLRFPNNLKRKRRGSHESGAMARRDQKKRNVATRFNVVDQTSVAHWPDHPNEPLLLNLFKGKTGLVYEPGVYNVDRDTLELKLVQKPKQFVRNWSADLNGDIRLAFKVSPSGKRSVQYRLDGERAWRSLKIASPKPGRIFNILSFTDDDNEVFVASNHEGDPASLYRFNLKTSSFSERLASHPRYDVSYVAIDSDGALHEVAAGDVRIFLSDKEHDFLEAIPDSDNVTRSRFVSRSYDDKLRIYEVSSSSAAGSFFLVDETNLKTRKLFDRRTKNDHQSFGTTEMMTFAAQDGLELDLFLALPGDLNPDSANNIPFVVMPHGGPWARDFAEFDDLTQYINSLGIGVLKVNFRGSDGYGAAFEELGVGQWGRAMQSDLNDALSWSIQQGWVNPEQVCMVGWSYGGYASLMASIQDSDKYKCAASIAGVTDLVALVENTNDQELLRRLGAKNRFNKSAIRPYSPIERAEEVSIPLFLAHGTNDEIVIFHAHYLRMLEALNEYGKDVKSLGFRGGDHSLSSPYDRQILFEQLGLFLSDQLEID